jgi:hypothetical protein
MRLFDNKPGHYRVEIPPRLWVRLEGLPARVFTRLNQHLEAIAELSAISSATSRLMDPNLPEMRFETDGVELHYVVDEANCAVIVRDVRRI